MQGKMWLYARNVIFSKKSCCTRHVLEGFVLKTNFKGHAETCLLIIFSSLGCVLFPLLVSSNFLGGYPNHEKILSRHGPTTHGPPLFFSQWLSGLLGRSCKNLEKTKKNKKTTGVHEWPGHRVSFFLHFWLFSWFVFNKANPCVVCDQIKVRLFKLSHMQNSCTPTVPCSVNFRHK